MNSAVPSRFQGIDSAMAISDASGLDCPNNARDPFVIAINYYCRSYICGVAIY